MGNLIDKIFSHEVEDKLYSTGNEDLDELLTRAYCDGYEDAQREFATPIEGRIQQEKSRQDRNGGFSKRFSPEEIRYHRIKRGLDQRKERINYLRETHPDWTDKQIKSIVPSKWSILSDNLDHSRFPK